MLDIVELIKRDPELRAFYMDETPSSHGAVWTQMPSQMYVRFWPQNNHEPSFNARFRYNQGATRTDVDVHFARRRNQIPLKAAHMRLWDQIRTELVLARDYGWHVWTGMAQQPRTTAVPTARLWDQHHVFFLLRNDHTGAWGNIVGLHYETVSFTGRWRETEQYRDWQMTSRNPISWNTGESQ